ncbi:DUF167 domain-containing protein [Actinospica sp. MGRD01-02]|uniref:UPF0235 protein KDK95_19910 n=1 Tax=Actinospica acidithermotolerans TaxID=2828514 RepID=A0A941EC56_9ACTN|nr:DUF167 domain-containing protein [Actinospica acidithermotolerans]MBR7828587.1 DUF167 domain-containing protein [Actinospica acidithermotolerans]
MEAAVKIAIRVKPGWSPRGRAGQPGAVTVSLSGSARARVGGSYGDAGALVVAVTERAVDGRATAAAVEAVAAALGLPKSAVTLHTGAASRDKVLLVRDPPADLADRLAALRG